MTKTKLLLFSIALLFFCQSSIGQDPKPLTKLEYKNKGILYQLTIWKNAVEAMMAQSPNNERIKEDYLQLKAQLDAAVNQFGYDMNRRNILWKKFDIINEAFKDGIQTRRTYPKKIAHFATEINQYVANCQTFINNYTARPEKLKAENVNPVDVLSLGWSIYKDLKDIQGKKVEGLTTLLNSIRLSSPNKIGKEDEGEKDKS